ncbi:MULTISPECIES: GNAT family N-acetyltransferase [Stutzerimonas stutzeri group]|uniref:L-methionine sulfoximine/L-methionine sulfone acetyltransferase n=2 Tax=Stutzerimonas balearica TaxID=74829 RepID=A0A9X7V6E7_9GAMM|nr:MULTISPECIES: GNAT family N-acetyltransferase [Stutzerimonas stutzeri group]MEC7472072.1 GNAT family N-acetyltransferase [Pseudomonadota bacterium]HCG37869.1 GNAT family N-acetyltransferase [Pseudomonas sp.]MCP3430139.1 GNAT family N-acetyltransferase [Stutzerimonas stutzeri]MDI9727379.1 GNAT family N-acetyltransferase [Stutzerimonas stutzeri]MDI9737701.1 GNAT family N-acetyltransferase [Stutzerimonas stutzeri]
MSTAHDLEPFLKETNVQIRDALDTDLEGILQIYNDAVQNSTAIWNDHCVDLANRQAWLAERHAQGYPVLVAIDELGRVAGYASFGPWRPHDGFRHTVENSVYVSPDHRGSGIGRSLMKALIERARQLEKHVMVAFIESENRASVHMHQQLGFIHVGQMRQVGCKFGRWLDLTMMQLTLNRTSKP